MAKKNADLPKLKEQIKNDNPDLPAFDEFQDLLNAIKSVLD